MTSDDLTVEQAEHLKKRIAPMLRFAGNLTTRMDRLGFPPGDPLKQAAERSRNTLADLHMALHYASCRHGVCRPEK